MVKPLSPPSYSELSSHLYSQDRFLFEPLPKDPLERVLFLRDYMLAKYAVFDARRNEQERGTHARARAEMDLLPVIERSRLIQMNLQAINFLDGHHLNRHALLLAQQADIIFREEYEELLSLHHGWARNRLCQGLGDIFSDELRWDDAFDLNMTAIAFLASPRLLSGFAMPDHAHLLFNQACSLYPGTFIPEQFDDIFGSSRSPEDTPQPSGLPLVG